MKRAAEESNVITIDEESLKYKDLIKVSLVTKPFNSEDDSNDWEPCPQTILNPKCQRKLIKLASHVKNFDPSQNTIIPESARLGISIENISKTPLKCYFKIDDTIQSSRIIHDKDDIIIHSHRDDNHKRLLLLKKHEIAQDEKEMDKDLIEKVGVISLEFYEATKFKRRSNSDDEKEEKKQEKEEKEDETCDNPEKEKPIEKKPPVKVKLSILKDKAMSLELGPVVPEPKRSHSPSKYYYVTGSLVMKYKIMYKSDIGYMRAIQNAGLPLPSIGAQQTSTGSSKRLEDIREKSHEIERKNVGDLLKFINDSDENLFSGVKEVFKEEGIDGVAFMMLDTSEARQGLKLRVGDQLKIIKMIKQIQDNSTNN